MNPKAWAIWTTLRPIDGGSWHGVRWKHFYPRAVDSNLGSLLDVPRVVVVVVVVDVVR